MLSKKLEKDKVEVISKLPVMSAIEVEHIVFTHLYYILEWRYKYCASCLKVHTMEIIIGDLILFNIEISGKSSQETILFLSIRITFNRPYRKLAGLVHSTSGGM